MTRNLVLLILVLLLIPLSLFSQNVKEKEKITIQFGKAKQKVGIDKGGGEHWKPLFFSIDKNGNIHIPDFYKLRIAVFNRKGKLIKAKACPEGISPRMNYFSLTPLGKYITYDDYTLSLIDSEGTIIWEKMLGYGVIPRFVWANEVAVFIVFPGKDERSIVFDYLSNKPIGRFGFMEGKKGIPMIMTQDKEQFTFTIKEMSHIPESGFSKGAFSLDKDAFLVHVDKEGSSLWKYREGHTEYYYFFSKKGNLMKRGIIHFPDTEVEGTGFWTACDEEMNIYKNYFYEDYMEIVVYGFE